LLTTNQQQVLNNQIFQKGAVDEGLVAGGPSLD